MKFVLAFDSFKHCLRAGEVCRFAADGIRSALPSAEILEIPLADGGEGTVDAACLAAGKTPAQIPVTGPLGEKRIAAVLQDGNLAVMEVASACGIEFVPPERRNPLETTTFGVGELVRELARRGVRKCVVGLGGSATVDGGIGLLRALGMKFWDASGRETDSLLRAVKAGSVPDLPMEICVASDVENGLTGSCGAAKVFGPQKGATPEMAEALDKALERFLTLFGAESAPGDGAAGGLGFAFRMLGAKRMSGAGWMLEYTDFDRKIKGADLVVTGEGASDFQTADGKLPWVVAGHAAASGIPAALVSGNLGKGYEMLGGRFVSMSSLASGPRTLEECLRSAPEELRRVGRNLAGLAAIGKNASCRVK